MQKAPAADNTRVRRRFDGPSERPQLSDEAAAYVRGLIISGELRPGARVRPETVGDALGISTTPAREALQALRVEGFLSLVPRRGFLVAPLTGQDIRDLFDTQALIAGELAARVAATATDDDVGELNALHHESLAAAARNDHTLLEEKSHEFHRHINRSAGAPKIAWVLGLITRYVPRRFYATISGWPEATVADHSTLLEAIRARDPDRTRAAMQTHIRYAGDLLATHFDGRVAGEGKDRASPDNQ